MWREGKKSPCKGLFGVQGLAPGELAEQVSSCLDTIRINDIKQKVPRSLVVTGFSGFFGGQKKT